MHALAAQTRAEQIQGLNQAQSYFQPAKQIYHSLYSDPSTLKKAPGG